MSWWAKFLIVWAIVIAIGLFINWRFWSSVGKDDDDK